VRNCGIHLVFKLDECFILFGEILDADNVTKIAEEVVKTLNVNKFKVFQKENIRKRLHLF